MKVADNQSNATGYHKAGRPSGCGYATLFDKGWYVWITVVAISLISSAIGLYYDQLPRQRPLETEIVKIPLGPVLNVIGLGGFRPTVVVETQAGFIRMDRPRVIPKGTALVFERWPNGHDFLCEEGHQWCVELDFDTARLFEPNHQTLRKGMEGTRPGE
jgi:hypothetical protein